MKTCKKLLALLLTLAMILAFAACDKDDTPDNTPKDPAEELYGEWALEIDLSDFIDTALTAVLGDFPENDSSLPFTISFKFDNEGKYTMKMNMKEADFDAYIADLCDTMVDYLIDYAESEGISEEDFRNQIESEYGMTLEEYAASTMEQSTAGAVDTFNQTEDGYYKLDSDKIYMDEEKENLEDVNNAEEYMVITLSSDKLIVTALGGEDSEEAVEMFEAMGLELPWEFKKQ